MDLDDVRDGFRDAGFVEGLIEEVLESYVETKRRFHLGDHRPQAVEGGRFSEGVFRMLQHASGVTVTPLGRRLPGVDKLLRTFEGVGHQSDSVRLHIPRTLRLIYDIRNRRDAAHLGDGLDPNLQDATLVIANMDWVLAELVRLYHDLTADEAQEVIADLVTRDVPAIQEIEGQPVILADLQARDRALLMLYRAGSHGAALDELATQLRVSRKDHLRTRLANLDGDALALHHPGTHRYYLTDKGVRDVEQRGLAQPV